MASIETRQFTFEPDMKVIREQCDLVVEHDPSLNNRVSTALRQFNAARAYLDDGDVQNAFTALSKLGQEIRNIGVDELEASCLCYLGFLSLAIGFDEPGIHLFQGSLRKSRNPWLALNTYNRLMIHFLSKENYEAMTRFANATKETVSSLPRSDASLYYGSAASYNLAEAHFRQSEFSEVPSYACAALTGFRELSMKAEIAKCLGLLGCSRISIGEMKQGLEDTEGSLGLFRDLRNEAEMAIVLEGRGLAMLARDRKIEAVRDFREALKLFKRLGDTKAMNTTLAVLSNLEAE